MGSSYCIVCCRRRGLHLAGGVPRSLKAQPIFCCDGDFELAKVRAELRPVAPYSPRPVSYSIVSTNARPCAVCADRGQLPCRHLLLEARSSTYSVFRPSYSAFTAVQHLVQSVIVRRCRPPFSGDCGPKTGSWSLDRGSCLLCLAVPGVYCCGAISDTAE